MTQCSNAKSQHQWNVWFIGVCHSLVCVCHSLVCVCHSLVSVCPWSAPSTVGGNESQPSIDIGGAA